MATNPSMMNLKGMNDLGLCFGAFELIEKLSKIAFPSLDGQICLDLRLLRPGEHAVSKKNRFPLETF